MIDILDVSYKYKSKDMVITNINLKIRDGETIGIIREKWFW